MSGRRRISPGKCSRLAIRAGGFALLLLVLLAATPGAAWSAPAALPERSIVRDMPTVRQWYSLSCEYAAAAAVTLYWGRLVSQRDFMREIPEHPNPHVGYRGNIHAPWGGTTHYGIYAEPLVPVLESYGYQAVVFYGGTGTLKGELSAGRPVVVWITGKSGRQPVEYETHEGETYKLVPYEHAVVAYGYDDAGVWIMDVGSGSRYHLAWSEFVRRWSYFDQMALAIAPAWD